MSYTYFAKRTAIAVVKKTKNLNIRLFGLPSSQRSWILPPALLFENDNHLNRIWEAIILTLARKFEQARRHHCRSKGFAACNQHCQHRNSKTFENISKIVGIAYNRKARNIRMIGDNKIRLGKPSCVKSTVSFNILATWNWHKRLFWVAISPIEGKIV